MQSIVGLGVGWKPVNSVDLFTPGGEVRIEMFFFVLLLARVNLGNSLAIRLDDLEIVIIDPNAPLEIALLADDLLGRDVEHVTM